jgi:hypothetical protein
VKAEHDETHVVCVDSASYAQATPTELRRCEVLASIDRQLLRSYDDATCWHLSTGNSYGVTTMRRAGIYRQATPTELRRCEVLASIDRQLLRSCSHNA